jgi:sterol desaturase/sphingolipid hydroxylase (fatty acid hydroxylase superfamily)
MSSRLCLIYFIPTAFMAYSLPKQKGYKSSFKFNTQHWLGRSAWQDYGWICLNALIQVNFYGHFIILSLDLSQWIFHGLNQLFNVQYTTLSSLNFMIIYTVTLTMIEDFSVYCLHRYMHSSPFLWSFHSVHHSATSLTPLTWLRIHPIEVLLNTIRQVIVYGFITGGFMFLSGGFVSEITLLGVNIFSLCFFMMGANLRHSHIPFSFGMRLENILISPVLHQIHHSSDPQHVNHNFGAKFAIWDLLFGTLIKAHNQTQPLSFGLSRSNVNSDTAQS